MKMLIAMFSTDSYKDKNIIRDCGVKIIIIGGNTTIDIILFHFEQVQNDPVMWSERSRPGVTDVHHTQIKWTLLFIVQKDFSFCLILKNENNDKTLPHFHSIIPVIPKGYTGSWYLLTWSPQHQLLLERFVADMPWRYWHKWIMKDMASASYIIYSISCHFRLFPNLQMLGKHTCLRHNKHITNTMKDRLILPLAA